MLGATFIVLVRLHLKIAGRYVRRYHKEVAMLIVVLAWLDIVGANSVEHNFPFVLFTLTVAGLLTLQLRRKDRPFLRDLLPNVRSFLLAENLILSLPSFVLLMAARAWQLGVLLIVLSALVSQLTLNLRWKRRRKWLSLPLPREAFEWRVGMRQRGILIIAIYGTGLIPAPNAAFALLGLLVLASNVANFYIPSEGSLLVDVLAGGRSRFLARKVLMAWALSTAFAVPLLLASVLRLHSHYWLVPAVWAFGLLIISSSVLMKYAYFEQGDDSRMRSTMNGLILMTSLMLLPFNFYYQFFLVRKARKRLPIYSHTDA